MRSASLTYAHSLFSLAEDENLVEQIFEEMAGISLLFKENPDYPRILDLPTVPLAEKCTLIDEAFGNCHEYIVNFLKILCEKKAASLFPECSKEFENLYNIKFGIEKVTVITAVPLKHKFLERLKIKLEKESGKEVRLNPVVDKTILGGIILKTQNSQTDDSVRTRLNKIRTELLSKQTN